MADFKKLAWMRDRIKTSPRVTTEDIVPSIGWAEDQEFHKLLIDLPGFKKSDVKLSVDESGTIAIRGRRKVSDTKRVQFEKTVKAPEDADITNLETKFVGDTLQVSMPKVVKEKKVETEPQNAAMGSDSSESEGSRERKEKEEPEIQNKVPGSDLREEKKAEPGPQPRPEPKPQEEAPDSSDLRDKTQAKEMKEPELQKQAPNSDLRDEAQTKEMEKPGPESQNEAPNSDSGDQSQAKEMEKQDPKLQKEEPRGNLREETESAKLNKDKEEPGIQSAASSSYLRHEESDKIEESEAKNVASDSDLPKDKSEELKKHKEEAADKQDRHEKEGNISSTTDQCHANKGKENLRADDTSQKSIIEKIIDQKAILIASIISFTLGVLLSPKFNKPQPK